MTQKTVVVKLGADISGVKRAMSDVKSQVNGATGGMRKSFSRVTGMVTGMAKGFGKVAGAVGAFKVVDGAINMITGSIDGAISRVDTLNQFPKVLQQMGYSAKDAERATATLKDGIDGLPTTLNEITGTTQRLVNVFQDVDKASESAVAINNAFLASGASSEEASRGVDQYVKMLSTGKVEMDSWTTLQETMPYALQKTAEAFGYTGRSAQQDLYKALQEGHITMDDFNDKIIELSDGQGGFAEVALEASKGIKTSWGNIKTAVVNGVANAIQAVNEWAEDRGFGSIADILDKVKAKISEAFSVVQETIPKVLDWFSQLFAKVSESTAFNTLKDVIRAVIDTVTDLWNKFSETETLESAEGVLKKIGDAILNIDFKELVKDIGDFLEKWTPLIAGIAGGLATFKAITGAMQLWTTVTTIASTVGGAFGAVMTFITSPIGIVTLAIGALIAIIVALWKNWDTVSAWLAKSWEWLKQTATNIFSAIGSFLSKVWEGISNVTKMVWDGIKAYFTFVFNLYKAIFTTAFNAIKKIVTTVFNSVKKFIEMVWNGIKTYFKFVFNLLKEIFTKSLNAIKNVVTTVFNAVKNFIQTVWNAIKSFLRNTLSNIREVVSNGFSRVRDTISNLMNRAKEIVVNLWNSIRDKFKNTISDIQTRVSNFRENLVNRFTKIKDSVVGKVKDMSKGMKKKFTEGIDDLVKKAKGIPKKIGNAISDKAKDAVQGVKDLANAIMDKFKSMLGIASPSKVFDKFGTWIIEGLKNGLTSDNIKSFASKIFGGVTDGALKSWDGIKSFFSGNTLSGIKSFFSGLGSNVKDFFNGSMAKASSGVQQWAGVATQALMMTGQFSQANLDRLLMQMQSESGGNSKAINLWDSNAKKGIPSKGLMQVIDPTFQAYKMPGYNDIWNPLDNILASIRYSVSRYGSLSNAWKGVGYASGGIFKGTHEGSLIRMAENGGDEAVLPLSNKSRMKPFAMAVAKFMPNNGEGNGDTHYDITIHATIREEADIKKLVKEIKREEENVNRAGGVVGYGY